MSNQEGGAGKWVVRGIVVVALAIAAWKIVPPWMAAQDAKVKWDEAVKAQNEKRYEDAIKFYDEAKAAAPEFKKLQEDYPGAITKSYLGLGDSLKSKRKHKDAAKTFVKIIEVSEEEAKKCNAYYEAAQCFKLAKMRKSARKYAELGDKAFGGKNEKLKKLLETLKKKNSKKKKSSSAKTTSTKNTSSTKDTASSKDTAATK